jgi:hypothetical protein
MFLCFGVLNPNNEFESKSRNISIGLRPNIRIFIEIIESLVTIVNLFQ